MSPNGDADGAVMHWNILLRPELQTADALGLTASIYIRIPESTLRRRESSSGLSVRPHLSTCVCDPIPRQAASCKIVHRETNIFGNNSAHERSFTISNS
uniref:Uncharacterized protein n=1 Tax=Physcomitrium patens TaxID=3218 RepID=A0A2K1KGD4_PHYPA|nr:hypothetical protein PHYPA_009203 [Physcomitrium patens]